MTRQVEQRSTADGKVVAILILAVNRKFLNKEGKRETDFFNLTAFGKTAEFCSKYFRKGAQVLVEGRIQNRKYDDKGVTKYVTDFIVEDCYFADSADKVEIADDGYITIEDGTELPF